MRMDERSSCFVRNYCLPYIIYRVGVVGIIYVYVDMVFGRHRYLFLNCLVGCLSMIVWTPAVLGVLYACVCIFVFAPVQRS